MHISYDVIDDDPPRTWVFGFTARGTLVELIVLHKAEEDLVIHCMKARKGELDKALRVTRGGRHTDMATSKKKASAEGKVLRSGKLNKMIAASALTQATQRGGKKIVRGRAGAKRAPSTAGPALPTTPPAMGQVNRDKRPRPQSVDEETIARLVAEAEDGFPAEKLRRRGRPAIGDEAASTYSVRLPDDLVTLADERSAIDCVTRGETIRRALIEYLTN